MPSYPHTVLDDVRPHPLQKGHHKPATSPYIFVDSCVQIWEDTEYGKLNEHSATAYCITTFRPDDDAGAALDKVADWHRIARNYDSIRIALTARDIEEAKSQNQAAIVISAVATTLRRRFRRLRRYPQCHRAPVETGLQQ